MRPTQDSITQDFSLLTRTWKGTGRERARKQEHTQPVPLSRARDTDQLCLFSVRLTQPGPSCLLISPKSCLLCLHFQSHSSISLGEAVHRVVSSWTSLPSLACGPSRKHLSLGCRAPVCKMSCYWHPADTRISRAAYDNVLKTSRMVACM